MTDNLTPFQEKINQRPCPVCGHKEFEWGMMFQSAYRHRIGFNLKSIAVRRCLNCNNLLQFVDEDKTRQSNTITIVAVIVFLIAVVVIFLLTFGKFFIPYIR